MNTHKYLHVKENRKYIPIMPPDLAPLSTFIGSNYPCLELINFHGPRGVRAIEVLFNLISWKNRIRKLLGQIGLSKQCKPRSGSEVINLFFMLSSIEHEILNAH